MMGIKKMICTHCTNRNGDVTLLSMFKPMYELLPIVGITIVAVFATVVFGAFAATLLWPGVFYLIHGEHLYGNDVNTWIALICGGIAAIVISASIASRIKIYSCPNKKV